MRTYSRWAKASTICLDCSKWPRRPSCFSWCKHDAALLPQLSNCPPSFALFFLYFPNDHKFLPDPSSPPSASTGSRISGTSPRIAPDWANAGRAFRYTACYTAAVIALSLLVWSWSGGDSLSRLSLAWTGLLALVALVASMIQFIPQILRTWKLKVPSNHRNRPTFDNFLDGRSPQHPRHGNAGSRILSLLLHDRPEPRHQFYLLDHLLCWRLSAERAPLHLSLLPIRGRGRVCPDPSPRGGRGGAAGGGGSGQPCCRRHLLTPRPHCHLGSARQGPVS